MLFAFEEYYTSNHSFIRINSNLSYSTLLQLGPVYTFTPVYNVVAYAYILDISPT